MSIPMAHQPAFGFTVNVDTLRARHWLDTGSCSWGLKILLDCNRRSSSLCNLTEKVVTAIVC